MNPRGRRIDSLSEGLFLSGVSPVKESVAAVCKLLAIASGEVEKEGVLLSEVAFDDIAETWPKGLVVGDAGMEMPPSR